MAFDHCITEMKSGSSKEDLPEDIDALTKEIQRLAARKRISTADAAAEIAENRVVEKKIAKRNAALNIQAVTRAVDYVERVWPDRPEEGLQAFMVGLNRAREDARMSVDLAQHEREARYLQTFVAEIEETKFLAEFNSDKYEEQIAQAVWDLGDGRTDIARHGKVAAAIAPVLHKWNNFTKAEANNAGAFIGTLPRYITSQTHDQRKIRFAARTLGGKHTMDEGENVLALIDFMLPLLDEAQTFKGADAQKFMISAWDGVTSGVHLAHSGNDLPRGVPSGFYSVAKRMSHERVFIFKGGKEWVQYNKMFGTGSLRETYMMNLRRMAKNTALMEKLGPNPQMTLDKIVRRLEYKAAERGSDARRRFAEKRNAFDGWMKQLDGSLLSPVNDIAAQTGQVVRNVNSASKLGMAAITSVTDIVSTASERAYQGKGFLTGYAEYMQSMFQGLDNLERRKAGAVLSVAQDGYIGDSAGGRFNAQDDIPGRTSSMMRLFYKMNLMTPQYDRARYGFARLMAMELADETSISFTKLHAGRKRLFRLYGIDEGMWDLMRAQKMPLVEGVPFFQPPLARDIPDERIAKYLEARGQKPSEARIRKARQDIEGRFRAYFLDRTDYAVLKPDARVKNIMTAGTRPGTFWGEMLRFMMQFKSFSTAYILRPIARDFYGRGGDLDSFSEVLKHAFKNGGGEMFALAHMIVMGGAMGYVAMAAKDIAKGRTPRDPLDPRVIATSFAHGMGTGIYTDFLFGQMKNRYGGGPLETIAGPTLGTASDVIGIYSKAVERSMKGESPDVGPEIFRLVQSNTPFANLFYTKLALDYLITWRVQEAMNPGYLRRMERRVQEDMAQGFIVRPSEAVR
jgi:hypothetical protein